MKISQLQALVAVAEHRNFTEAALALNISQSAVSHAIASLEDELGVSLLSRGRHGAHPTGVGERIIRHAHKVLQLLDDISHEATLEKGLLGGTLCVASFRSAATHLLPPVIARFRSRFPHIAVSIIERDDYDEVDQVLREGRADIGLTYAPNSDEFDFWEITRDEYVVLIREPELPTSGQLTWEELTAHSFILSTGDGCTPLILRHCATAGHSLKVSYRVKEDSTILGMVAQGLGVAIMPRLATEPLPQGVAALSLPGHLERVIGVAILANALHSPAVFAFLDAVRGTGLFATKAHQKQVPALDGQLSALG
ncbi:LysR family transcriptional regulator [Leptolyngbya sp. FACHB-261]|uniref:LysR family transcriptional regulator n=1 Tax=Leptolyngbya sp. FACHB-261 TaxID=2692806 RepID=UPI00168458B0|nr:LysR family transcriptional regulator [Leptolyngbya sp. FACHB-261]MBD2101415.1 LysR family transcriptional regulator [Leptolyngbya sp. FACHB-261]